MTGSAMTDCLNTREFRRHAHEVADWIADYFESVEQYPVRSQVQPGDLLASLPGSAPKQAEPMERILEDFRRLIPPGMTHWQHPAFFAFFPANSSPPSVLAEMLTAGMAAQCMLWETSPAANELEGRMMEWLQEMLGLPSEWRGVIQDSASGATVCAMLAAREKAREIASLDRQVFYTSAEANSSVHKGARIAGFGLDRIRSIETDAQQQMNPAALVQAIRSDRHAGLTPACVVITLGTTGTGAMDPLAEIGEICRREDIYLHVDAAWAGSALMLPEYRYLSEGMELADSFVFNPHKWMFTNFDCSAHFLKDPESLQRSLSINPVYLQNTSDEKITEYRDFGISLGRRFRALKLWFVIRSFGVEGLQEKIRSHIRWAEGTGAGDPGRRRLRTGHRSQPGADYMEVRSRRSRPAIGGPDQRTFIGGHQRRRAPLSDPGFRGRAHGHTIFHRPDPDRGQACALSLENDSGNRYKTLIFKV